MGATGEVRDKHINFRFTRSERDTIDRKVGSRNRSEVLRRVILGWARSGQDDPTIDDE